MNLIPSLSYTKSKRSNKALTTYKFAFTTKLRIRKLDVSMARRHLMMTPSNGSIFRVTGHLWRILRSSVNSPHKGQWRGSLAFSLICAWINNSETGYLRHHRTHNDVTVMWNHPSHHPVLLGTPPQSPKVTVMVMNYLFTSLLFHVNAHIVDPGSKQYNSFSSTKIEPTIRKGWHI